LSQEDWGERFVEVENIDNEDAHYYDAGDLKYRLGNFGRTLEKRVSHTYSVHLQPRELVTKALPTIGAKSGPTVTARAYAVMAFPRCLGGHMSLKEPAVTAIGAEPKKPQKNLLMKIVCESIAVAVANAKQADTKNAGRMEIFRP
jgi:hypothetical protein